MGFSLKPNTNVRPKRSSLGKLLGLSFHPPPTSLLLVKEDESYSNDHEKLKTFDLQLHALILIHSKMLLLSKCFKNGHTSGEIYFSSSTQSR